uniref:BRISC and BRCA1-A complex member 1-like n=1 Tax=Nicotiana tabacum TaxID=4097 RepID=A0A1S4C5A0_TOBAC|nr:PREDICTED: uncharacterized protein LOC107815331 [Nicotiana tabacum]
MGPLIQKEHARLGDCGAPRFVGTAIRARQAPAILRLLVMGLAWRCLFTVKSFYQKICLGSDWWRDRKRLGQHSSFAYEMALLVDLSPFLDSRCKDLFRCAFHGKHLIHASLQYMQILLYCRSSIPPQHQWPATQKLFTLDVIYLHDKPGPDNCPQKVYDALVEALELVSEYEAYIFESGQGLTRVLFRHICTLLSHPQQRCCQDDIDIPKSLAKKSPVADPAPVDENAVVSSQ